MTLTTHATSSRTVLMPTEHSHTRVQGQELPGSPGAVRLDSRVAIGAVTCQHFRPDETGRTLRPIHDGLRVVRSTPWTNLAARPALRTRPPAVPARRRTAVVVRAVEHEHVVRCHGTATEAISREGSARRTQHPEAWPISPAHNDDGVRRDDYNGPGATSRTCSRRTCEVIAYAHLQFPSHATDALPVPLIRAPQPRQSTA
jgi:hypothetical protein